MAQLTPEQKFWSHVERGDPDCCWQWKGTIRSNGYGAFHSNGRQHPAHRIAWELANNRTMEAGLDACHACDNRSCVNPNHIWPGTRSDNMKDAVEKGRHFWASRTHCANGHEYTPENTRTRKTGDRACLACHTEKTRAKRQRCYALGLTARGTPRLKQWEKVRSKMPEGHNAEDRCSTAKLTSADVVAIRALPDLANLHDLARQYGVTTRCIRHIYAGQRWKCIPMPTDRTLEVQNNEPGANQ